MVGSHKGGTGKSTTAMHLVAGLLYEGLRVASMDLDNPQQTLTRYIENRKVYKMFRSRWFQAVPQMFMVVWASSGACAKTVP